VRTSLHAIEKAELRAQSLDVNIIAPDVSRSKNPSTCSQTQNESEPESAMVEVPQPPVPPRARPSLNGRV
jgi:hypothetical protein